MTSNFYLGGEIVTGETVTHTYSYDDADWADLLTAYDGHSLTYDAIGNPLTYYNGSSYSMTWAKGRQLASVSRGSSSASYAYDMDGIRTSKTVNGVTTEFITQNGRVVRQSWSGNVLDFFYDSQQRPYAVTYKPADGAAATYYYITNLQGDVVALIDSSGSLAAEYTYNAWGAPLTMPYGGAGAGAVWPPIAELNPLRYRGYYYDAETGFYYLQSRYYDSKIGRFINADSQLDTAISSGLNLFSYCENNPVNRSDPTGEAWWHWALGAAIVAAAAVATFVTCGCCLAAAATAVYMVGSGAAAVTTASTVAAGAFIGSATVYGMAVLSAASTSKSVQEFKDQGNWGTVTATAFGGLMGGYDGYTRSKAQTPTSTPTSTSRGSTGRTEPANLAEKIAMEQVKSNPLAGTKLYDLTLNDPRWPSSEGWVKMQQIVPTSQGNINIHYVYNQTLKIFDDFKFNP